MTEGGAGLVQTLINAAYLVAAALFIIALRRLSSPTTARSGNLLGALGMFIAIVVTLLDRQIVSYTTILAGILVGGAAGAILARTVKMTAMPQMVGLLNGFGGGASTLVAAAEFFRLTSGAEPITLYSSVTIVLTGLIGAVTFSGSMIAFGKLQELVTGRPVTYPLQKTANLALFLAILALGVYLVTQFAHPRAFAAFLGLSLLLGVLLVIPIGGADMPVVISLLNAYSGLAGAAAGFVLQNNVLIVSGALVGASGIILTQIMCWAMNRSLANVLFGAFGAVVEAPAVGDGLGTRTVRDIAAEDAAMLLGYARSVIVVPGYGLAVAQAQHQLRELADLLGQRGVDVKFAIHPVAGRMPGHMNVLLAEANVPYDKLYDLEVVNPEFERTDVALVVGANDVVNPAARNNPGSPIYGMPILDVDKAGHAIFMKRSLNPGFAGIDNELFYNEKTYMFFGDAKKSLMALIGELKNV
ncbi:MAG: NAD(P)(+) transhydrogenase (Re/Si-specific) subunit beta [Gemmatimonadetes bacterium]|nr:NAD(P)(+) transhydrogenase (Re/Si-specific) subunit beta [Gemmatimonadota bacterium]